MFFFHRIKHINGSYDKGIEVKDTLDAAKQAYHAQLGAYAYNHDQNTDFCSCMISDESGAILLNEVWEKSVQEPESEPEE